MKQFLKITLATVVGLLFTGLLCFIILFSIASASLSSDKQYDLKESSVLKLTLDGTISEQSVENPFNLNIPGAPVSTKTDHQGLDDILAAIRKAKTEDKIKGIYLEAGNLNAGFATVEEIRDALADFKKSGKYVIAYGDTYDQREYFLCSVADKVFINPEGMLNFCGLAATPVFYSEALKKIGIQVEVFRVGTFKSAVEPFINTKMSPANRLQTTDYLNGIWGHLLDKISASRNITVERLNQLADQNQLFQPTKELLTNNLVDSILYESQVKDFLAAKNGVKKVKDLNEVSVDELLSAPEKKAKYIKDKVAVLYADGEIYDKGTEGIVQDDLLQQIDKIKDDDHIKAVVFRVNSPGGSAYASEQIWKALADLKAKKPIVVSMGDYAASGGYYISCNANKIIASPNTLTGSIGVFGTFFNVDKLTEKVGLDFDVVKTNDLADIGNISRPMTTIEKQKIQRYVEHTYALFVHRCSNGRHMKAEDIMKIAEGRVWTGKRAVELGLADEIGGIDRAIQVAAKLGKTTDYKMVYYPEKENYLTEFIKQFTDQTRMRIALSFLGSDYAPLVKLKASAIQTGILARMDKIDIK
ncbi:MAG: signal peptide peptidase SppA [Bacteroidota bacterium]|nr:signal peptide peptidase SppA [Bacteroidota bacterium]